MILNDWFLSEAGMVFFVAWSVLIATVSVIAFGRDIVPTKAPGAEPSRSTSLDRN